MKLIIDNHSVTPLPIASADEGGWAESISPDQPYSFDRPDTDVVILGDKPSFTEEFKEDLKLVLAVLVKMITVWRSRVEPRANLQPVVDVTIANEGPRGLRVLLGSNTNEYEVGPGESYVAQARGYVEIRELSGDSAPPL